jgi:replicative DNA helicase
VSLDLPAYEQVPGGTEDLGRTPPQDVAAEQSVLGGMMLSKDAIADVIEQVRGSDFYRPAHELVYDAILDLYGRGEPADAVTVAATLTSRGQLGRIGGPAYLHTLLSAVPTAANAGFYARIVRERAVLRRLVEAGTRIVQLGYAAEGGDVDALVNTAQAEVYSVTDRRVSEDYVALGSVIEGTIDEIEASSHRGDGMIGVPTGFADLDQLTNGLHPGQMIVIAARPAIGKALALDTPLPTPSGWTTMGEVAVGDQVLAADGTPTEVVAATEVMTDRPCYEVRFDDGTVIVADAQHQWALATGEVVTSEHLHRSDGDRRVNLAAPLDLPGVDLPLEPYALGALLAAEGPLEPEVALRADVGDVTERTGLDAAVRRCLRGSHAQRRDLLAGVLDVAGSPDADAVVRAPTSPLLDEVLPELLLGLGLLPLDDGGRLRFRSADDVFWREDRRLAHKEARATAEAAPGHRRIVAAEPVVSVPVRCIEVAHPSHLYLASRSMVPTHNSTIGLDIARSASIKHGMTSVVFSLEMSKNEITMRLLSAEAKIPLQNMRKGTMREEDWTKLARTMGQVSEAPLFIDDSPNMTLMEIRAKCRRIKQQHDLKLVVIDYLQLMTSGKRVESRQQEVSEFSRALKLLAKELEVPVIAISQLNRGPEQRTDKRPAMSDLRESGCLPAESRILRADTGQEVTMGALFESGARDVPVWALDDSLRYVKRHLTHVFTTGTREVFRLRLASGKEVRATANHPFLTYEGWRPLDQLGRGSRLAVPRHVPPPELLAAWSDDRVLLLAHLIGDGSFVRRQPLRYASVDEDNLAAVTQAARTAFGISAVRDDHAAARCTSLRLPSPHRVARGRRNPLAAWLDDQGLFGLRSHEKFVPPDVFSLPKRQVALFIRHLWATDGSVTLNKDGRGGRVYYASTSKQLTDDVSRLLLRFGISTRVRSVKPRPGTRAGFTLDISGADEQRRFLQEIGVHGGRAAPAAQLLQIVKAVSKNPNIDTVPREVWNRVREVLVQQGMSHRQFAAAMGTQFSGSSQWKRSPSRERLSRIAELLQDAELEMLATNDVLWDEVLSIEPDGVEQVYDATVLGAHNFVANGVAVHNSIEQDADMVILLHREDAYDRESPRAGEADLIVAKHRNGPTDTIVVAFQGHYSRFVDMAS